MREEATWGQGTVWYAVLGGLGKGGPEARSYISKSTPTPGLKAIPDQKKKMMPLFSICLTQGQGHTS